MKKRKKIEQLEFRLDLLKDMFSELVLKKDYGVVLLWADEYDELKGEADPEGPETL